MRQRTPNRLPGHDYSCPGAYFVTINVRNRDNVFGEISNGLMVLNEWGIIAEKQWLEIPSHFNNCRLDEFIVMPDHFHGITIITAGARPLQRQYQLLPIIIGSYKSSVSKKIHQTGKTDFRWQRSFWDRIIRDEQELNLIRRYIIQNPVKN
jgi:REP element-mobilizing transposase RayT